MVAVIMAVLVGQSAPPAKPKFEVISIKLNSAGSSSMSIRNQPGGGLSAQNVPLLFLMTSAYRVRDFQILGGPNWMGSDRWDIEARAEEGAVPPNTAPPDPNVPDARSFMLQSLIEDRFQLKMHRETRELPVYELVPAKGGAKVKLFDGPPSKRSQMRTGRGDLEATGMPFAAFVNALSQQLGRPIVDKTGLQGLYDLHLQWTLDLNQAAPDSQGPSVFTAVQEQLGLRLESTKGPVDVIIIDSVQRPSEN